MVVRLRLIELRLIKLKRKKNSKVIKLEKIISRFYQIAIPFISKLTTYYLSIVAGEPSTSEINGST